MLWATMPPRGHRRRRVAGTVHLTSPRLAASAAYQRWAAGLPGHCILAAGAEAGPGRPGTGLGFHASARTLAKLHAVSPRLFPLPARCRSCRSAAGTSTANESMAAVGCGSSPIEEAAVERLPDVDRAAEQHVQTGSAVAGPRLRIAEAHIARLLLSLEGGAGRSATVSDTACPADLDAGVRPLLRVHYLSESRTVTLSAYLSDRMQTRSTSLHLACLHAGAVQLKLLADNPQAAAHAEQLRASLPELTAADEPQRSSACERSEEWCRQWHPRFPLPAPGADVQIARGAGEGCQPSVPWEQPNQLLSQGAAPLHVVLADGTLGVLAANVWANGQQGPWQPVLVSPPSQAMSAVPSDGQHPAPPPPQRSSAKSAAQGMKRPSDDTAEGAHQQLDAKRTHSMPDDVVRSNQAAARLLRERMQRRSEPADANMEEAALKRCVGSVYEPRSAEQLQFRSSDGPRRDQGTSDAPPIAASAQSAPITAAEAPGGVNGVPAGVAVPQCLRRMAAAGDDSEVVFLGTGCAEPSKYRGASGILLRSDHDECAVCLLHMSMRA